MFRSCKFYWYRGGEVYSKRKLAQSKKEKIFISERLSIVKEELKVAEIELKESLKKETGDMKSHQSYLCFFLTFSEK